MKKSLITILFLSLISQPFFGQGTDTLQWKSDDIGTLFGNNRPRGAYGSVTFGYSTVDNEKAVLLGGKIMWIAGHSFGFGFGGNGFINEYHYDVNLDKDVFLTGGYGGLYLEPIVLPRFPVHLSFPVLFGAGGVSYITKGTNSYHNMIQDSQVFLIVEPSAELELNITRHFRLALGTSYRFTTPFKVGTEGTSQVSTDALRSWSYMVTFKFGRF